MEYRKKIYPAHIFTVQYGLAEHIDKGFMVNVDVHIISLQIAVQVFVGKENTMQFSIIGKPVLLGGVNFLHKIRNRFVILRKGGPHVELGGIRSEEKDLDGLRYFKVGRDISRVLNWLKYSSWG